MVAMLTQFSHEQKPALELTSNHLLDLDSYLDNYLVGLSEAGTPAGGEVMIPAVGDHTSQQDQISAARFGSDSNSSAGLRSPATAGPRSRLSAQAEAEARDKEANSSEGNSDPAEERYYARQAERTKGGGRISKQQRTRELQEKNRKAQRRFRERQKNKVTELEGMVAELNAKLSGVAEAKAGLESRVNILMRVLQMRDEQIEQLKAQRQGGPAKEEADVADTFKDNLTLTVREDQALTLTPAQVKAMTREDLVLIWKEYVKQLAMCLIEVENNPESSAAERIKRLTNESTILCMRVAISNPLTSKSFVACKLEGSLLADGEESPEMWLPVARSLNLTPIQRSELVQLRRLFLQKLGAILEARQAIHAELRAAVPTAIGARHAAIQFLKAHEGLDRLKRNLRDEHVLKLDWISTLFKHMLTPLQVARCMVQAYPWCPDTLAICSWIAAEDGDTNAISVLQANTSGNALTALSQASQLKPLHLFADVDTTDLPANFPTIGLPATPIPGSPPPLPEDGMSLMDALDPTISSVPMVKGFGTPGALGCPSMPMLSTPSTGAMTFQQTVTTGL